MNKKLVGILMVGLFIGTSVSLGFGKDIAKDPININRLFFSIINPNGNIFENFSYQSKHSSDVTIWSNSLMPPDGWIKYNDGFTENALGTYVGGTTTEAIQLTSTELDQFRNYIVVEIRVSIGSDDFGSEPGIPYEVWIQDSLPSNPTNANVVGSGTSTSMVWHTIDVTDYPIPDAGDLYIGVNYVHNSGQCPCGIDETSGTLNRAGLLWSSFLGYWTNLDEYGFNGVWGLDVGVYYEGNHPPVADAGGPYYGEVDEEIIFDGSASYDPDGWIVGYRWDWTNDGKYDTDWLTNPITNHTYNEIFNGSARLEVMDNDITSWLCDIDLASVTVIEENLPPDKPSRPSGPNHGYCGVSYTYSTSATDPDDNQVKYGWDWDGDDLVDEWSEFLTIGEIDSRQHSFSFSGQYSVHVKAEDPQGEQSEWSQVLVVNIIENGTLLVDADGPYEGNIMEDVEFDSIVTGGIPPYEYFWDYGDGNTSSGDPHPTHNYGNAGNYTVVLTVTDSEDDTASDTTWTYINAPPNKTVIDGLNSGKPETLYNYTFTSNDPDGDDIAQYIINWGDGPDETISGPFESGIPQTKSHKWDSQGTYTIKAKATDIYGAESEWSTFEVSMPKNKTYYQFNILFERFLQRFPFMLKY